MKKFPMLAGIILAVASSNVVAKKIITEYGQWITVDDSETGAHSAISTRLTGNPNITGISIMFLNGQCNYSAVLIHTNRKYDPSVPKKAFTGSYSIGIMDKPQGSISLYKFENVKLINNQQLLSMTPDGFLQDMQNMELHLSVSVDGYDGFSTASLDGARQAVQSAYRSCGNSSARE